MMFTYFAPRLAPHLPSSSERAAQAVVFCLVHRYWALSFCGTLGRFSAIAAVCRCAGNLPVRRFACSAICRLIAIFHFEPMRPFPASRTLIALFSAVLMLAACGDKPQGLQSPVTSGKGAFQSTDISGIHDVKDFALTDHHGKARTLADFKGKAVVVFFGYTQCPDVCPTTMTEMANVMQELGPLADRVQVLFVTVDPERDTVALLSQYVPTFDPRFLGMVGDKAATEKVAKDFHIFYQKVPGKEPGSYTMDHSAGSYVFDPQGRIRLFIRHGQSAASIASDLKLLLK